MTDVDNPDTVRVILDKAEALLLDFDGPICSIFVGITAPEVAGKLCDVLINNGRTLPSEMQGVSDPFKVLHYASQLSVEDSEIVEAALTRFETEAIPMAKPTVGIGEVLQNWTASRRTVAVVSNNSEKAVRRYLQENGLSIYVGAIIGRRWNNEVELKPSPNPVRRAVRALGCRVEQSVLIGDSESDAEAAWRAGVPFIGFANKPHKVSLLSNWYAAAIVTDLKEVATLSRRNGVVSGPDEVEP